VAFADFNLIKCGSKVVNMLDFSKKHLQIITYPRASSRWCIEKMENNMQMK
jgi:hypothetical protein